MNSNAYEKLATVYIRLVRSYSASASSEVENIYNLYGARAAYQAAMSLSLIVGRAKRNAEIDPCELATHQLADIPQAIPLFHKAAAALTEDLQIPTAKR